MTQDERRRKMRDIVAYELQQGLSNIEQRIATSIDEDVIQPVREDLTNDVIAARGATLREAARCIDGDMTWNIVTAHDAANWLRNRADESEGEVSVTDNKALPDKPVSEWTHPCGCHDWLQEDGLVRNPCYAHSRPLFADMEPPSLPPPYPKVMLVYPEAP